MRLYTAYTAMEIVASLCPEQETRFDFSVTFTVMAEPVVQFGDMADTCSETWLTPQVVVKSIAPIRCAPKKMP